MHVVENRKIRMGRVHMSFRTVVSCPRGRERNGVGSTGREEASTVSIMPYFSENKERKQM